MSEDRSIHKAIITQDQEAQNNVTRFTLIHLLIQTDVSKNRGKTPKMDGLFHGKPDEQMDDLGGFTTIFGNTQMCFGAWFP